MMTTYRPCSLAVLVTAAVAFAQPPQADVIVAQADVRRMPNTITLVGTVEPLTRSLIGSEMAGIVDRMPVRQGDLVKAGDLLVQLNNDTVGYQLAEARASQKANEARLRRWEFEVDRLKRLYGDDQANQKELYDAEAECDWAKYSVEEQKAIVGRLETDLGKTAITAPFGGFIIARHTEVGEWLDRGGAVVEIVDLSQVLVRVDVPEDAIPFAKEGDRASIKIDALDRVFDGIVRHVIRQADPKARTFPVEVVVDNPERQLAAGMFARANVISGPEIESVAVPKDALVIREGIAFVGLIMPGPQGATAAALSPVTFGADVGEWMAITSGNVPPGAQVVIRGNERLFPFPSPVRIVDASGTPVAPQNEGVDSGKGRVPHAGRP